MSAFLKWVAAFAVFAAFYACKTAKKRFVKLLMEMTKAIVCNRMGGLGAKTSVNEG